MDTYGFGPLKSKYTFRTKHKEGSKGWYDDLYKSNKEEFEDTKRFLQHWNTKNKKIVLLKNRNIPSNYNKKNNTIYVNQKDMGYYQKLRDLLDE